MDGENSNGTRGISQLRNALVKEIKANCCGNIALPSRALAAYPFRHAASTFAVNPCLLHSNNASASLQCLCNVASHFVFIVSRIILALHTPSPRILSILKML